MGISLHAGQSEVYEDLFVNRSCRFSVVRCSRGWGKSYMAAAAATTAVYELLSYDPRVPNKNVYIVCPTYDQVKDIYYPILAYDMGLEALAIKASRDLGKFTFYNNVELRLLSYEAVERMRGRGAFLVVWDEISSCKVGITAKEAWQAVIQPCIATRWSPLNANRWGVDTPGRALMISTPRGYNFFHELSTYEEKDPLWKSYHFDFTQSPFLDPDEIDRIKHTIDPIEFASEYLAEFKDSGNSVFYCFDRKKHLNAQLKDFDDKEVIHIGVDFNVSLQCTSIAAIRGNQIHILYEMKGHPDTEELAKALVERFKGHKIYAYPDPSGRSRKTSAPVGRTDFSILESHGIKCYAHKAAPSIVDSVAAVNRKLLTAAGDVEFFVHPRCEHTIRSLERTRWKDNNADLAQIDKSENVEHFSDGVRYLTEYLFPVEAGKRRAVRGFGF